MALDAFLAADLPLEAKSLPLETKLSISSIVFFFTSSRLSTSFFQLSEPLSRASNIPTATPARRTNNKPFIIDLFSEIESIRGPWPWPPWTDDESRVQHHQSGYFIPA